MHCCCDAYSIHNCRTLSERDCVLYLAYPLNPLMMMIHHNWNILIGWDTGRRRGALFFFELWTHSSSKQCVLLCCCCCCHGGFHQTTSFRARFLVFSTLYDIMRMIPRRSTRIYPSISHTIRIRRHTLYTRRVPGVLWLIRWWSGVIIFFLSMNRIRSSYSAASDLSVAGDLPDLTTTSYHQVNRTTGAILQQYALQQHLVSRR